MALRKASSYSRKRVRPFTRKSAKKNRAYIKTVPFSKIVKFRMGDVSGFKGGKHGYIVRLISEERVQIRDNALESGRMWLHKILEEKVPGEYYLVVKVYPHHFLRENKTAAGAGADRLSSGMKHSFGIAIGRAALVSPGKEIFLIACPDDRIARIARDALGDIKSKVPGRTRILFQKVR